MGALSLLLFDNRTKPSPRDQQIKGTIIKIRE
jgi:hypothetical protein